MDIPAIKDRVRADQELLLWPINDPRLPAKLYVALLQSIHDRDWLIEQLAKPPVKEIEK